MVVRIKLEKENEGIDWTDKIAFLSLEMAVLVAPGTISLFMDKDKEAG